MKKVTSKISTKNFAISFSDGSLLYCNAHTHFPLVSKWNRLENNNISEELSPLELLDSEPGYWGFRMDTIYKGNPNPLSEKISPYVLGLWAAGTVKEQDIIVNLSPECQQDLLERGYPLLRIMNGVDVTPFMLSTHLKDFNLVSHSIPMEYIFAPIEERKELLRGLTVMANKRDYGHVSITLSNITLLSNIRILLASLGVLTTIKKSTYNSSNYYTLSFPTDYDIDNREPDWNRIKKVIPFNNEMEVTEITVTNKYKDYVTGDTFIPVSR